MLGGLVFALSAAAQSQQPVPAPPTPSVRTANIQGFVRYADSEKPADMAKVELRRFSGELVALEYTRTSGEFRFFNILAGSYIVTVSLDGYLPVQETVDISLGPQMGMLLYLRKIEQPNPAAPSETVSVRELSIPTKARTAFRRGVELAYQKQDIVGGIKYFDRAIRELPGYYEAYYEKGMLHIQLGQYQEAEQAFRKSLELSESQYARAYFGLAGLFSTQGRYAEAEASARKGLELDSASWQGLFELGRALLGLDRTTEAESTIQAARQNNPDYAPVYLLLANVHIRQKNYPALLGDLEEYLKRQPEGPDSDQARALHQHVRDALASQNRLGSSAPKP
jgi:Tfp pilus assembly protein PilF